MEYGKYGMEKQPSLFVQAKKLSTPLIYFINLFLLGLILWTKKFFGTVTIEQTLSTFYFGFDGVFAADSIYLKRFIEWCLLWPFIIFCSFYLLGLINKLKKKPLYYSSHEALLKSLRFERTLKKLNCPWLYFMCCFMYFCHQFSVYDYLKNTSQSDVDYFKLNYVDPKQVAFKAARPKSLVLIYIESMESTYANKEIAGRNLLEAFNQLQPSFAFSHYQQMPGSGWTIAGIISTQCGIPLKQLTLFNGNQLGENIRHFLPNAACLSDILAAHGYHNVFMNGSASSVGGKERFFKDHHYDEIWGKQEWLDHGISKAEMTNWGLSDNDLMNQAKLKLAELIHRGQLFNLTLLTVDMHGFSGQLSKSCQQKGYHDFDGIVECTASTVSDFVRYIKAQGWLNQLNVVILGDHLAMQNSLSDKLVKSKERFIFNLFLSKQHFSKKTDEIIGFDMLPTLLHFLGFEYPGDKLGLGYSTISQTSLPSFSIRTAKLNEGMRYKSKAYDQLWTTHELV